MGNYEAQGLMREESRGKASVIENRLAEYMHSRSDGGHSAVRFLS